MKDLVEELKKYVPFKETTEPGDIVLLVGKEAQLLTYAVVTAIDRDKSRKDEWWHVSMQILSVPLQPVVWTLRVEQFTGQEIFTMGGEERFVKAVAVGDIKPAATTPTADRKRPGVKKGGLRRIK